jgi:dephospho-CoA kinase
MLRELGAAIVDADKVAREVVAPGSPALQEIRRAFGDAVILEDGTLDRTALGSLVFADDDARKRLNAITHPRIGAKSQQQIAEFASAGEAIVIYEAALLVENKLNRAMAALVVVSVSQDVQKQRLMQRDGLTEVAAQQRIDSQMSLADKLAVADYVIDNSGSLEETRAQTVRVWQELKERFQ